MCISLTRLKVNELKLIALQCYQKTKPNFIKKNRNLRGNG